jgi:hypothetical protein
MRRIPMRQLSLIPLLFAAKKQPVGRYRRRNAGAVPIVTLKEQQNIR